MQMKEIININGTKLKVPRKLIKFNMPFIGKLDKFPVLAIIFEKRGSSYLVDFDWVGYRKDEKNEYYQLKKRKTTFKPPQLSQVKMTPDGKNVILLWSPARNQYIAKDIIEVEQTIKSAEKMEEVRVWLVNEVKRISSKGQDWLTRHLPLITVIMVLTMTVIVIYVTYDGIAKIVGDLKGVTGVLKDAIVQKTTGGNPPAW